MPKIKIDGIDLEVEEGTTILEAARFLGLEIPTLCDHDGLTPWGGCRLCIVELGNGKITASCTYPAQDGLVVRTATKRVIEARKMLVELMLSIAPYSKTIQDLASKLGVTQCRFTPRNEECVYCGLCVRICEQQMMAGAIGFANRGENLKITTPFDKTSEVCRRCGACIYICPACSMRCPATSIEDTVCSGCYNALQPTCIDYYDDYKCYMGYTGDCGTCVREKRESKSVVGNR